MDPSEVPPQGRRRFPLTVLWVVLLPVAVGVAIYLAGRSLTPDPSTSLFGNQGTAAMDLKARLGSALLCLALIQLLLALWMYRRLPGAGAAPRPVRTTHRVIGLLAFLLSLPIAYHCLVTYGIETSSTRVTIHSITGCVLYGLFVAKVIVVRSRRLPGWALPLTGGLLVGAIALMWYAAALWDLNGFNSPGL
jgi:hypothetical protein